jgi:arsenate reductase
MLRLRLNLSIRCNYPSFQKADSRDNSNSKKDLSSETSQELIAIKKVLFVCVENAGRSQIAEAFANKNGKDRITASSAGNKPADKVNPIVVQVMKEKGIDISNNRPKLITAKMAMDADLIFTMGCNDQGICPGPSLNQQSNGKLRIQKEKP